MQSNARKGGNAAGGGYKPAVHKEMEVEVMKMTTVSVDLTAEEIQLIYAACMSYGDKLSEIIKSIPNESSIINELSNKAKESWELARKITKYMEEKS